MTDEEIEEELERLLASKPAGFAGCENFNTWREVFEHEKASFYVGSTSRKIRREAAGFLNRKTCPVQGRSSSEYMVFTPMVTHPNGKRIKGIREAEDEWGFHWIPFFKNVSMYNCVRLEWALQRKFDYLSRKLCRRMWYKSGVGKEYKDKYGKCMVYISLSFEVLDAVASGKLIRGRPSLTQAYDKADEDRQIS